jgi:hypothetical protein
MNFIFKIIKNYPETKQLVVKYSIQNSIISIDDRRAYAIDYEHINFTSYESFTQSIISCGIDIIEKQISEEPCSPENLKVEITNSTDIYDNLNKIIAVDNKTFLVKESTLNKIEL